MRYGIELASVSQKCPKEPGRPKVNLEIPAISWETAIGAGRRHKLLILAGDRLFRLAIHSGCPRTATVREKTGRYQLNDLRPT